jgi:DNA-binding MarR family transcriptional regulator
MTEGDSLAVPADPAQVAARLRRAVGGLVRATRRADVLAPIPAAAMDLLDRQGPMTTADLAASRQVRHQTMAATVKDLRDVGYITAVPDQDDGRKKVLSLTARGRAALDDDRGSRVRQLAGAIADTLSDEEVHTLAQALMLLERVTVAITGNIGPPESEPAPITGDW